MDIGRVLMELLAKRKGGEAAPPMPTDASGVETAAVAGTEPVSAPPEAAPEPEAPAPPVAEAYKSPPDLVAMYTKMLDQSRRAAAFDSGATLIAAGFAQPAQRNALIALANEGGSGGAGVPTMSQLLELQKYQTEITDRNARRQNLPAIMKQYNLDPATTDYLDRTGALDEVLSTLANPETEVVEAADKSKMLIDSRTGALIRNLSPKAPRETEYVEAADGSKTLVYKDTKQRVDTGEVMTGTAAKEPTTEYRELANGTIQPLRNGLPFGEPIGPESELITTEKLADGTVQKFVNGVPVGAAVGPKTEKPVTVEKLADGTLQAFQNGVPLGNPVGPETDLSTDDIKEWKIINKGHIDNGEDIESLDDWIVRRTQSGTEAGTQASLDKTRFGTPPDGQYFVRDATGAVLTNEDGTPKTAWDTNSKGYQDWLAAQTKAKTEATTAEEAAGKVEAGEMRSVVKDTVEGQNIDRALEMIEDNKDSWIGVGGVGGWLGWVPASDQKEFNDIIWNIGNKIGLDELQAMRDRAAATTGASGLGQVTEGEHQMLRQSLGVLSPTSKPEVLRLNLRRIEAGMDVIAYGVEDPPGSGEYRKPTEADVASAMAAIKDEESRGEVGTSEDVGGSKVTLERYPEPK